jgi:hypothetical protein
MAISDERGAKALEATMDALMEYFDTVQIFVSKNKGDDQTVAQAAGRGSIFARVGQVGLWLAKVESSLINIDENDDSRDDEVPETD